MAVELVENYMKEELENNRVQTLNKIIKGVLAKEISLVELVETLGPYLTNQDANERCKGTQLLALVLHRLSSYKLLEKEVNLLVDFFCDRLQDHFSVVPHVISGLLALVSYQTVTNDLEVKIVQALFKEIHVQSLLQTDRHNVFTLFAILLNKANNGLQSLGADFVFGFLQTMDGEKDPRNLLLAFQLVQIIIKNFPITLFAEDLFEVTSCYFPIDFTPEKHFNINLVPRLFAPTLAYSSSEITGRFGNTVIREGMPANDPNAITREELILALRSCLSATSLFAPFCLPMLLEKMASDIIYAKKDALLTLAACANVYDSRNIIEFITELWNSIRKEIFTASDHSIELAGYEAIKSVGKNIARAEQRNHSGALEAFLTQIFNDCKDHLSKPDHKLMKTSCSLLQTVAMASDLACSQIVELVFPILFHQFEVQTQISNQKAILDAMLGFLQVAKDFVNKDSTTTLANHKEKFIGLFFSLLIHHNPLHRSSGIAGLVALVSSSQLNNKEVVLLLDHLVAIILDDKEKIVRHEAKLALVYLSSQYPPLVRSQVVTQLTERLTTTDNATSSNSEEARVPQSSHLTHEYLITTLATLCTSPPNVEFITPCLIENLRKWSQDMDGCSEENVSCVLDALQSIFDGSLRSSIKDADYFKEIIFLHLLELPIEDCLRENAVCFTPEILEKFSKLVRSISSNLSEDSSASMVSKVEAIFLDHNLDETKLPDDLKQKDFDVLKVLSPWQQTQLVTFLTATLCNVSKKVVTLRLQEFLHKLLNLAIGCGHKPTNIEASKCLAGLINRIKDEKNVDEEVSKCVQTLDPLLVQQKNKDEKWRATMVLIWITKALLIRAHNRGIQLLEKLLGLFCDLVIGQVAADGFFIIMSTPDDVMVNSSCANIKLMYKQRIFIQISPVLTERFHSSPKEQKHLYLCALSHILHWLPKQVLLSEIPTLLPLLVQSLSCEETNLQLSTLDTFYSLTHDVPKIIAQYITSLIPRFLNLAQNAQPLKIRSLALKCLGVLTVLPHHEIYPYKNQVVRTLVKCLDDHKRLVRKEAVKCRNEWILLGMAVD